MPEGPSIMILKESVMQFKGKKIMSSGGTAIKQFPSLDGLVVTDFKTWGKHFLICFKRFTIRVHLMLFGTYRINESKEAEPKLHLQFTNGELNFYTCSLQLIEEDLDEVYDWTADVMNKHWSAANARKKMKERPDMLVCDALMDQQIFSGVGNIIKNEVLFRVRLHPLSKVGDLPPAKMRLLLKEAVNYTFDFYKWKKEGTLKKHWLAYSKKTCPRDHIPFEIKNTGRSGRRTFFCNACQEKFV